MVLLNYYQTNCDLEQMQKVKINYLLIIRGGKNQETKYIRELNFS